MSVQPFLAPGGKWLNKKTGIFDKLDTALFGNKEEFKQLPTINPEQQGFLSQMLQQLMGGGTQQNFQGATDYNSQMLSGSPEAYQRFAQPHMTQFQEQTIPRLAERFAGLGGGLGGGAMGSSGFAQALGGAGTQFQSNLAGLYAQLQQQAASQAFNQYNTMAGRGLGTQSFENVYQPGTGGILGGAAAGAAGGAGQGASMEMMMKLLPLLMA